MLRITETRALLFIKGTLYKKNYVLKSKIARNDNKTVQFLLFS
jgi:hypothetical protein